MLGIGVGVILKDTSNPSFLNLIFAFNLSKGCPGASRVNSLDFEKAPIVLSAALW